MADDISYLSDCSKMQVMSFVLDLKEKCNEKQLSKKQVLENKVNSERMQDSLASSKLDVEENVNF